MLWVLASCTEKLNFDDSKFKKQKPVHNAIMMEQIPTEGGYISVDENFSNAYIEAFKIERDLQTTKPKKEVKVILDDSGNFAVEE